MLEALRNLFKPKSKEASTPNPKPAITDSKPVKKIDSIQSAFEARRDRLIQEFCAELNSIPHVEIICSDAVPRKLMKDLPEYTFSNVTRKTKRSSIFPLVALDVETTGLAPSKCEILEVSAIKFETGMVPVAAFTTLCKPNKPIPEEVSAVNHITDDIVADAPSFSQVASALSEFIKGCNMVGHNLDFDLRFIHAHGAEIPQKVKFYDTLDLARLTIPKDSVWNYKLDSACNYYQIWRNDAHRSLSDSYAAAKLFACIVHARTGIPLDADAELTSELYAE